MLKKAKKENYIIQNTLYQYDKNRK